VIGDAVKVMRIATGEETEELDNDCAKVPPASPEAARHHSPSECVGTRKETTIGKTDPKYISTSYTERANLTMQSERCGYDRVAAANA
jgi:hypothetical protein